MAENESLDLGTRHARRWDAVYDAVRKGQPSERVAKQVGKKLCQSLRKAIKQLAERGVSIETLLANRHSPNILRKLLRQSEGHDYVALFSQTAITEKESSPPALLSAFVGGAWEAISDQIAQHVAGKGPWTNFVDLQIFLNEVSAQIEPEVQRISQKLADDPTWMPTCKVDKSGTKSDPTADMMSMSLLGIQKK